MRAEDSYKLLPAREFLIDETHAGQRIDNFLSARLKGLPRARIYRILRRGEVRVNRGRIRQHYRLSAGDVVRVPPVRLPASDSPADPPAASLRQIEEAVLYEHDGLVVVDKPSGMAVHGGSGVSHGVIEALRAARPGARMLELVHRLDRETSGCLMVATRRDVLTGLHEALRLGGVEKSYVALLTGRWRGARRCVDAPLLKNQVRSGERVVRVDPAGKPARTLFEPLAVGHAYTLVLARPVTGRTHQIRVHAASIGMPIAGDAKYGDRGRDRAARDAGLGRLFLHARRLRLHHPVSSAEVRVEAALPASLEAVLDALGLERPQLSGALGPETPRAGARRSRNRPATPSGRRARGQGEKAQSTTDDRGGRGGAVGRRGEGRQSARGEADEGQRDRGRGDGGRRTRGPAAGRQDSKGQGSKGQGSKGQGSKGQGSKGQGSKGPGSKGPGSKGHRAKDQSPEREDLKRVETRARRARAASVRRAP